MILAQCLTIVTMLTALALRPPEQGAMMAVPLDGASQGTLMTIALRQGGLVLGAGPTPGSLVVYDRRASLAPALWAAHAVLIAAPMDSCGAGDAHDRVPAA